MSPRREGAAHDVVVGTRQGEREGEGERVGVGVGEDSFSDAYAGFDFAIRSSSAATAALPRRPSATAIVRS